MRALTLALLILLTGCSSLRESAHGATALDAASTAIGIGSGAAVEVNPLIASPLAFISSGPISHDMAALLPCKTVTQDKDGKAVVTTAPGMPEAVPALATKAGISTTKTKITALYAAIDVSDQPPFEAMARLGLQIVQVPLP